MDLSLQQIQFKYDKHEDYMEGKSRKINIRINELNRSENEINSIILVESSWESWARVEKKVFK